MKNIVFIVIAALFFVACEKTEPQPAPAVEVVEKKVYNFEEPAVKPKKKVYKKKKTYKKKKKKVAKKVRGTYYKMTAKSIEAFAYRGNLRYVKVVDDRKLKNPFYIKGKVVKIEKIYRSKIGDRYGKIAGKNLLVSMDDLKK